MKNLKRFAAVTIAAAVLTTAGAAFAAEFKKPVEIASELTGESVESLRAQRLEGKMYGDIAEQYGKLDEFKAQRLEQKKAILDEKVQSEVLTQEEADKIYNSFCSEEKQMHFGKELSADFGKGLHMSEDGQGKKVNANMNLDGQGKRMNMSKNGQGRGPGKGFNR